jgi:hypothetical protein
LRDALYTAWNDLGIAAAMQEVNSNAGHRVRTVGATACAAFTAERLLAADGGRHIRRGGPGPRRGRRRLPGTGDPY